MQEISIESVGDLAREVRGLQNGNQKWLFRGQPDARWDLLPSVHRGYTRQQERYLTNEFRVRARSRYPACPSNDDYPGWLALMQHYGLPTRLLDWTYSPLVAAFFALHPEYVPPYAAPNHAACVWVLSAGELNASQGFEPLIFPLDAASYQPLIAPAFKTREEPETIGVAMAIEHDARIQLQQGAFTIHSARTPLNKLAGSEMLLRKLVIRHEAIQSFFDELSLLGMRKSNLFPDLASLTSELRAMHPPAHPGNAIWHTIDKAQVLGLASNVRDPFFPRQEQSMEHEKSRPAGAPGTPGATSDQAGLENLSVTQPAPPASEAQDVQDTQDGAIQRSGQGEGEGENSLENLNVTRPGNLQSRSAVGGKRT